MDNSEATEARTIANKSFDDFTDADWDAYLAANPDVAECIENENTLPFLGGREMTNDNDERRKQLRAWFGNDSIDRTQQKHIELCLRTTNDGCKYTCPLCFGEVDRGSFVHFETKEGDFVCNRCGVYHEPELAEVLLAYEEAQQKEQQP